MVIGLPSFEVLHRNNDNHCVYCGISKGALSDLADHYVNEHPYQMTRDELVGLIEYYQDVIRPLY